MTASKRNCVLVDTGPIVAILAPEDSWHAVCIEASRTIEAPLFTCWPVITEAAYLLRYSPSAVQQLLRSMDGTFLEILPLAAAEAKGIAAVMRKYESVRPQLADAALVYLAEREEIDTVFTLDRRDFSVYRTSRRRGFRILPQIE
jgi:uncharacterized protein